MITFDDLNGNPIVIVDSANVLALKVKLKNQTTILLSSGAELHVKGSIKEVREKLANNSYMFINYG